MSTLETPEDWPATESEYLDRVGRAVGMSPVRNAYMPSHMAPPIMPKELVDALAALSTDSTAEVETTL